MPKFPTGDKVTVTSATALSGIAAIPTPASATAEACANKINEILAALKTNIQ